MSSQYARLAGKHRFTQTLLQHAELVLTFAAADQYAQLLLDARKPPLTTVGFGVLLTTAECRQRAAYHHHS